MNALIALSAVAGLLTLSPAPLHTGPSADAPHPAGDQDRCRYEETRSLTVPVRSGQDLRLDAGSGSLDVVGVPGLTEIRAEARACASHEDLLDELDLTWEERGSSLLVETHYPDRGWSGWGNRYARLDLTVEVPEGMAAEIRDGSGEMHVRGVGELVIDDGSGEMEIQDVRGSVRIDDGSGEIDLWDVTGDVEIDDGSGEIDMEGIGGEVRIADNSGEIDIREVERTVRILRDGSGSIDVAGVGGDFIVERDGSGSIDFRDVAGRVDIPRKKRR